MHFHQVQAGDVTIQVGQGAGRIEPRWPVVVGSIPPRADCFQDRPAAMAGLIEAGAAGRTAVVTQADPPAQPTESTVSVDTAGSTRVVSGLGGVGKTQLAAAYARDLLDTGAVDVLVWVPAATRAGIVARYALAAEGVGLACGDDPEVACGRFVAWLATADRRWVVVLDDLSAADDLRGCGRLIIGHAAGRW